FSSDDSIEPEPIQGGTALSPGFLRLEAGLMFADKFSVSVNFRYQIIAYSGGDEADTFMPFHIEARFSFWFLKKESLWAYAFAGSGYGMIQPAIGIDGENYFQDTGLNNVSAGGGALIRFGDTVGLNIQLDFDY